MKVLVFALLLGMAGQPQDAAGGDGIAIAKRLVAAIKGDAQFQDSDFARKLDEFSKAALRKFAKCKIKNIGYFLNSTAERPYVFVEDVNSVSVRFNCKGVSKDTPVGISLHLQAGKVARIETHNADLMRVD